MSTEFCTYCSHPIHAGRCISFRPLLIGSEPCPCKARNNAEPKPPRYKIQRVNNGQCCDASQIMPTTVTHPCQVHNSKAKPNELRLYELVLDGATIPAWLCRPHFLAAEALAGVEVA